MTTNAVFRLGDTLSTPVYDRIRGGDNPVLLLAAGQRIDTEHQLLTLREAGIPVLLPSEQLQLITVQDNEPAALRPDLSADFEQRIEYCLRLKHAVNEATRELHARISVGEAPEFNPIMSASTVVANEVSADPQAFAALTYLRGCDDYTVEHSVDVSILMVAIAHTLGVRDTELDHIALAGLLHDVGKQLLPQDILRKPGKLTPDEFQLVRMHPEYGLRILAECKDCPEAVLAVTLQHHERLDGSGYPLGVYRNRLHPYSLISAVADVFDAITANRAYHIGISARQALLELHSARGRKYDPASLDALIKLVGTYPVGTRVKLNTGERGMVIAPNREDPRHPIVEVDTHPAGRPIQVKYRARLNGSTCWIAEADYSMT
jgi:putative nucleotidyltransferase with HDIG domain